MLILIRDPYFTAQKSLPWQYLATQQMNYDYNMSRYVQITLTCNYKNIFWESVKARQETEQLVSLKKCLIPVKNQKYSQPLEYEIYYKVKM